MPDIYTVRIDGVEYDLQGDHEPSEAEARAAVGGQGSATQGTAPPADATAGMMAQSTSAGDPQPTTAQNLRSVLEWGGKALGSAFGMGAPGILSPANDAVEHPTRTLALAAAGPILQKAPGIVARGLGISSERAGQNIQAATQVAKDVPLGVEGVGREGLRALELQAAGGSLPRVATQLMQRITKPGARDLTFDEARDFYSNLSRLSTNEFGKLNPTMQRQIGAMRQALHESLVEGAETVGAGQQYASGIKEYARSAKAAGMVKDKLSPAAMTALRRIAQGAGLGGAFEVTRRALD